MDDPTTENDACTIAECSQVPVWRPAGFSEKEPLSAAVAQSKLSSSTLVRTQKSEVLSTRLSSSESCVD